MNVSFVIKNQNVLEKFTRLAALLQSPLLLILRLYFGYSFFQSGKGKLENLDKTVEFFGSLGLPFPKLNALLAGGTECFGGLLLLVGLAARLISVPLAFTMLVAYFTADREALFGAFKDPDAFLAASPFLFLLVALIVIAFGPGVFSLDWLIARKLRPLAGGGNCGLRSLSSTRSKARDPRAKRSAFDPLDLLRG